MSYEKKMKDLMARLVSMSPEPPPYPEEIPMARHLELKRSRPVLVFAAAAALVAILAVPLLLFTGGGDDPDILATTTSTLAPESSTTTVPSSTTTTVPMVDVWSGVVFLYQEPENSFGENPALVPVSVTIAGPFEEGVDFSRAMASLTGEELPGALRSAVPSDVIVESTRVEGDTVIADMNEAFLEGAGGTLADFTMLNQLIYTLTYESHEDVQFTVGGRPVEAFGGNGIGLTSPVGREDFRDELHVINLVSPIAQQDDGTYLVQGITRVFEGNVDVAVLDAGATVVHEEFLTAGCGSGCWGEFSTSVAGDQIVPGESFIRIFTYSAEDGSPVDIVTVPIPEGGVWELTAGG